MSETPSDLAKQGKRNDEWVSNVVAPAAKRTQDNAGVWPVLGVGPFCAVVEVGAADYTAAIATTMEEACTKLRSHGYEPFIAVDYVRSARYGNRAMRRGFAQIVDAAMREKVALVGGESSEHDDDADDAVITCVTVLGRRGAG
jgi:phosphoribosylaminoimidazole (AIR) synthetase